MGRAHVLKSQARQLLCGGLRRPRPALLAHRRGVRCRGARAAADAATVDAATADAATADATTDERGLVEKGQEHNRAGRDAARRRAPSWRTQIDKFLTAKYSQMLIFLLELPMGDTSAFLTPRLPVTRLDPNFVPDVSF